MKKYTLITFLLFAFSIHSQVIFHYDQGYKELLNKTFIFVLGDSPKDKEMKEVVDKYWKLTKYKIIPESEIDNNLATSNVFFQIMEITERSTDFKTKAVVFNSYTEFAMWSPTEKGLSKSETEEDLKYRNRQFYTKVMLQKAYTEYYNWSAGYLKNYLQLIQDYIKTITEKGKAEHVSDPVQVRELQNTTLYLPLYTFDGSKLDDLFKKYKFKYAEIKGSEINKKILNGEKVYYMLTYMIRGHAKIIDIINSETGQVVYHYQDSRPLYPYLTKDDIQDISKLVEKND